MKKIFSVIALCAAILTSVYAQKTVFNATAFSEKDGGQWSSEMASKTVITVNQTDSFIEIAGDDPEIFQITKTTTSTQNGAQITEFTCSDNEANNCTIKLIKGATSTKIYFTYPDTEYYYILK